MLLLLGVFLCQAPCLFVTTADIPDFVNRFGERAATLSKRSSFQY